jgi:uncharacterized protein
LRPRSSSSVTLGATLSPSEDPQRVLEAMKNVLGEVPHTVKEEENLIRVESSASESLDRLHDQLRDRHVRGAARRRFLAGRSGRRTTVMVNRQAAAAGIVALCDSEEESPLGPVFLTIESRDLDETIRWLTAYEVG